MTNTKEAKARIKINELLKKAGWRFFADKNGPENIQLEVNVKNTKKNIDNLGEDFEETKDGYADFILLDKDGFPLVVLEAKKEEKDPLDGKEQARRYAKSQNARFVLLSNGNSHYFWDLDSGNPEVIIEFPTQESFMHRTEFKPNTKSLSNEHITEDYIALSQNERYKDDPLYQDESTREKYLYDEDLRIMRPYQLQAIHTLQKSAEKGNTRFLFEMATGTGKTLVSGAVIKLFLRTGNAKRVLFLVDRLELESQAHKNFKHYLEKDFNSVTYKESRDDWKKAEIVISTVQSFTRHDKYKRVFSPTDFDLVISDEAHRSITGNSRAVFEYFVGYKLGLTATPKDYLKNVDAKKLASMDPRAWERRQLLDTYTTFGCSSGEPTYRYSLNDGVKHGFLINPHVLDARTDITTEILSEKGYAVKIPNEYGEDIEESFFKSDFEKRLFSEKTNMAFCKAIIDHALYDPLSKEMGKSVVFCISQKHASKITQILNQLADKSWPNKYNSDFAVQVTSNITGAQQMAMNFSNNNLNGKTKFLPGYKSSKTRVCVTARMMTTGYDCKDIMNLALLRPVFSPTDFVQIKGRGTRTFIFKHKDAKGEMHSAAKDKYNFFDFFANFEYFEKEFNYDEEINLPFAGKNLDIPDSFKTPIDKHEIFDLDKVKQITITPIGAEGMKIDRKLFEKAKEVIQMDDDIKQAVSMEQWEKAEKILREKYEGKPELYLTLEKIRISENIDRGLSWREFLERVFDIIDRFKSKEEKMDEEVEKFISIYKPDSKDIFLIKNFLKIYIADNKFRDIINSKKFSDLNVHSGFPMRDFKAMPKKWREQVPEYVNDYVPLNQYIK